MWLDHYENVFEKPRNYLRLSCYLRYEYIQAHGNNNLFMWFISKKITFIMITLTWMFIIGFCSHVKMTSIIDLDTSKLLTKVDPRYLSVALGMINKNWKELDLKNQRVINMAKALSPAFVRLGGTGADLAIFDDTKKTNEISSSQHLNQNHQNHSPKNVDSCNALDLDLHKVRKNFTFTKEDWVALNEFTKHANWTLLFDVNVILKRKDGCWDATNFRKLLKFSYSMGYKHIAWELGIKYKLRRCLLNITLIIFSAS